MNSKRYRKILAQLLVCWIFPKHIRKEVRKLLINFSIKEYFYYKNLGYKIVPLGDFCLPRVVTTVAKLKPYKYYGEKSYPFDLCLHGNMPQITECINRKFDDYIENIVFDEKRKTFVNKKYGARYIHETKMKLPQIKNKYKKRIQNFKNTIANKEKIYFIYSNYDFSKYPTNKDVADLYNSLCKIRKGLNFELILLLPKKIENINNPKINQIVKDWEPDNGIWVEDFFKTENQQKVKLTKNKEFYTYLKKELTALITK